MENKQTSVEWLEDKINTYDFNQGMAQMRKYIAHAKVMNEEQIVDAWEEGWNDSMQGIHRNATYGKGYYNETYGK